MNAQASDAAASIVDGVRATPWGVAVAVVAGDVVELALSPGADPLDERSVFQVGSITKTMTGFLVADCVVRGEAKLDDTVGSVLGADAGNCAALTLRELATQRSGLPRLPPNLDPSKVDRRDPYAGYTGPDLLEALRLVAPPIPSPGYSNFGFMLLGMLVQRIAGASFADVLRERLLEPLGLEDTMCGVPDGDGRLPGYALGTQVPWWRNPLPGAGGVASSIRDLAAYAKACLSPPAAVAGALSLALDAHADRPRMGLGWVHEGEAQWHNGATGGFRSFVAVHRASRTAVAVLANGDATSVDAVARAALARLVRRDDP